MLRFTSVCVLFFPVLIQCAGFQDTNGSSAGKEENPVFPVESDDAFFHQPVEEDEVFRVLISKNDGYQVRQVAAKETIRRKPDPVADKEFLKMYLDYSEKINFKDMTHNAMLRVRLNPQLGKIENIDYPRAKDLPRAYQAAVFFKDDVARMQFTFPNRHVDPREFYIRFEWRIQKEEGLTEEEARKKVIEYLKEQKRGN